jgi:hypothetical protein
MKLKIKDWRQDFGKPAYPRKVLTLKDLESARNIVEAWGDDPITLTGAVLERHKQLKIANTQHGATEVHVGSYIRVLLSEIEELHEMLIDAKDEYLRSKCYE